MTTLSMTTQDDALVEYIQARRAEGATDDEIAAHIAKVTMKTKYAVASLMEQASDSKKLEARRAQKAQADAKYDAAQRKREAWKTKKEAERAGVTTVRRRITEDDASMYGVGFLGHEGEMHTFKK